MNRFITWLLAGCFILLLTAGCGILEKITEDPFVGRWIGITSLPGIREAVVRITIDPADSQGRYPIRAVAERYADVRGETGADRAYRWETVAELQFTGQVEGEDLYLNKLLELSFMVSKVTGSLTLKNGTELHRDTGQEYPALKQQMRDKIREKEPNAKFAEEN